MFGLNQRCTCILKLFKFLFEFVSKYNPTFNCFLQRAMLLLKGSLGENFSIDSNIL